MICRAELTEARYVPTSVKEVCMCVDDMFLRDEGRRMNFPKIRERGEEKGGKFLGLLLYNGANYRTETRLFFTINEVRVLCRFPRLIFIPFFVA